MRKKLILILLCILGILYLQYGRTPTVNNIVTSNVPQGYVSTLTITANKLVIVNKDKLAHSLVERTINNDFDNLRFSYDVLGYPNELTITVYANSLTKCLHIPAFKINYSQETPYRYNIKNHPEMYTLVCE